MKAFAPLGLLLAATSLAQSPATSGGTILCSLSFRQAAGYKALPGAGTEGLLSEEPFELGRETQDAQYRITISRADDSGARPFRLVLRNKRSAGLISHLDGTLAMLRQPGGATLRVQAPEGINSARDAQDLRLNCLIR